MCDFVLERRQFLLQGLFVGLFVGLCWGRRDGTLVIFPDLFQELIAPRPLTVRLVLERILLVIILVVPLRVVESGEFPNLRGYRFVEPPRFSEGVPGFLRDPLLLPVMIEDHAPVIGPPIPELPTGVRRVDVPPEEVEKLFVCDFRWIVEDLHRLDVPLLSVILIGRVFSRAARIAGDDLENPGRLFKIGFHTPETAAGEGGDPGFCIHLVHVFFYLLLRGLPRCGYQHKKERRDIDKNSFHIILPKIRYSFVAGNVAMNLPMSNRAAPKGGCSLRRCECKVA